MSKGIIDAMYWRLHSAYLRNQREEAAKFLSMLEEEAKDKPDGLLAEVGPVHLGRFRLIRERMRRGEYGRLYSGGSSAPDDAFPMAEEVDKQELEFCWDLVREPHALFSLMDVHPGAILVRELEMGEYGRCDFLVRDGRTWHVVEVKMGEAPFSVVAQIDKYRLAAELDMCMGLHDEVRAHVLAGGFGPYVASELSRLSVSMMRHKGDPDSLEKLAS